jgi:uncharacterized protein (DUF58 family)
MLNRVTNWLETNWVAPAYAGYLLGGISICFFGAATNTMAGWLYVLSGVGIALLGVAAILPPRSLRALTVKRMSIAPVTAGAELEITIAVQNPTSNIQTLFQVQDLTPFSQSPPPLTAIETIPAQGEYRWVYRQPTQQRGVYQWARIVLRSGAPIGLFWCQRYRQAAATAYVYPQILTLAQCPLIEGMGERDRRKSQSNSRQLESATEGVTRSLRPYRYGDPFRSIHWRTSARLGEFQVRELEIDRGGEDLVIYLDSGANWDLADFEQAVIAACSLYFYANRSPQFNVKLQTGGTQLISNERQVLETLAAVQSNEQIQHQIPPTDCICLTSDRTRLNSLSSGSRWLLWNRNSRADTPTSNGMTIDPDRSLEQQLSSNNISSQFSAPIDRPSSVKTVDLN